MDQNRCLGKSLLEAVERLYHLGRGLESNCEFAGFATLQHVQHGFHNLREVPDETPVDVGETQENLNVAMAGR